MTSVERMSPFVIHLLGSFIGQSDIEDDDVPLRRTHFISIIPIHPLSHHRNVRQLASYIYIYMVPVYAHTYIRVHPYAPYRFTVMDMALPYVESL